MPNSPENRLVTEDYKKRGGGGTSSFDIGEKNKVGNVDRMSVLMELKVARIDAAFT